MRFDLICCGGGGLKKHAHTQPANILLDSSMNARLGDAGIARVLDAAESNAAATQVQGTLNYMDPGYMRTGTLNDKSDIYRYAHVLAGGSKADLTRSLQFGRGWGRHSICNSTDV